MANGLATECDDLIQQAQSVTHAALARPRQGHQAAIFDHQSILIGDMPEPLDDFGLGDAPEIVVLAS